MPNQYTFKITMKQQVSLLSQMIISWPILLILVLCFSKFTLRSNVWVFIILFFIDTLPTLILHLQYYLYNRCALLTVNSEIRILNYKTPKREINFSFDEIINLDYYRCYGKGSGWHSFGMYRYYKIEFINK